MVSFHQCEVAQDDLGAYAYFLRNRGKPHARQVKRPPSVATTRLQTASILARRIRGTRHREETGVARIKMEACNKSHRL